MLLNRDLCVVLTGEFHFENNLNIILCRCVSVLPKKEDAANIAALAIVALVAFQLRGCKTCSSCARGARIFTPIPLLQIFMVTIYLPITTTNFPDSTISQSDFSYIIGAYTTYTAIRWTYKTYHR